MTACGNSALPAVALSAPRTGHPRRDQPYRSPVDRRLRRCLTYGFPQERTKQLAVAGTPTEVAHHLAEHVASGAEPIVVINDLTPWRRACDLLKATKDKLAVL